MYEAQGNADLVTTFLSCTCLETRRCIAACGHAAVPFGEIPLQISFHHGTNVLRCEHFHCCVHCVRLCHGVVLLLSVRSLAVCLLFVMQIHTQQTKERYRRNCRFFSHDSCRTHFISVHVLLCFKVQFSSDAIHVMRFVRYNLQKSRFSQFYKLRLRYEEAPSRQYLQDLFHSVQLKDIVSRNKIRDVDLLERIIAYALVNVGSTFSATSLARFLKSQQRAAAPETILNYLRYCCDTYLFYQVKREDLPGKQILSTNEKYYIADHGIREVVYGGNTKDINLILENIVCLELLRRGYKVTAGRNGAREIAFVCTRQSEKLYVQVTYLLASEDTVAREFGLAKPRLQYSDSAARKGEFFRPYHTLLI